MLSSSKMLRSAPGGSRTLRVVAVILAIAAMLCVSAVAASPAHSHLKDPADRCDICATAHLAVKTVAVIQIAQPLELRSFLSSPAAIQRVESHSLLASLSRGPPSSL